MAYSLARTVALDFETAVARTVAALKLEGFGVLSDIDVQATLKAKLGVDTPRYRILGACNPGFAHQALQMEAHLGVLLPCNVVVREQAPGQAEVVAIDPVVSLGRVDNAALAPLAAEVRQRLQRAVDSV